MKTILFKTFSVIAILTVFSSVSLAHWTTKGPYGGSVSCFTTSDTLVFTGTVNGGVYRTTSPLVTSWRYANYTGLSTGHINALTYIEGHVIAGSPDQGVFVSTDIGATWTQSNTGLTNTNVLALITAGDHVIAGTNGGGIFLSHDSASTWMTSSVGLTNMTVTCFAYDGTNIYAGTSGGGVFVSIDEGDSWTPINNNLSNLTITSLAVSGSNVFAGTSTGVFSTDAVTINWTLTNTGLANVNVHSLVAAAGIVYAATDAGVFSSPDASISWNVINGYTGQVNALQIFSSFLVAGTQNDGILKSPLASPILSLLNTGFNNLQGHAIYNDGNLVVVATNKGVFVSTDLAANYYPSNNGLTDSTNVTCFAWAGSILFAGTQNAGVFMSTDTGSTWIAVNAGLGSMNIRGIVSTATQLVCAAGNGSVYYSPLVSVMWTAGTGISGTPSFTSIASDGGNILLGSQTGIYFSSNGVTYSAMNTGLTNTTINDVLFQGSNLYAATNGGGIFKAQLGTFVWSTVNTGIPSMNVYSLAKAGVYMAAGFQGSVYATNDNGANWFPTNVMDYLPEYANIHCISWSTNSTRIFVATPFNGFYSNGVAELPAEIDELKTNLSFSMYPNPSNGFVQFDISNISQEVNAVHVFDVTGKMVHSFNPPKAAMQFATQLHILPGTYMVQLQTEGGAVMQKLVVE